MRKIKTINILEKGTLLPPAPDKCQVCAASHRPEQPHNADSMYYKFAFLRDHKRSPTWRDAMAHCSPDMKNFWIEQLKRNGIEV